MVATLPHNIQKCHEKVVEFEESGRGSWFPGLRAACREFGMQALRFGFGVWVWVLLQKLAEEFIRGCPKLGVPYWGPYYKGILPLGGYF